jgi:hypothetical protein
VGERETVGLELVDDLDLRGRCKREDLVERGPDRVATADLAPVGRDDDHCGLFVERVEGFAVTGVQSPRASRVRVPARVYERRPATGLSSARRPSAAGPVRRRQ